MKKKIEKILETITLNNKNIIELNLLKKIDLLSEKIIIHLISPNPTMHIKNKLIKNITNSIKNKINTNKNIYIKFHHNINSRKESLKIKKIIAIASGKGGVGKSTIASNISVTLANMGFNVGLLDSDIYGPSIPLMFNIKINDISILHNKNGTFNPIISHGVKILSIGFFSGYGKAIVWRGPMVTKALIQFIYDTNWGKLDFLIIDLPPGTGDIHLSLLQEFLLNGIVIVSTSQKVAISDVIRTIEMFRIESIHVPILGIIENMSFFITNNNIHDKKIHFLFGKNNIKKLSKKMNLFFLGEIPFLQEIQIFSDFGKPAIIENNTVKDIFIKITKNILDQIKNKK
ncbi:Mrp/NBP35 family ATP-binding protein [Blattabacterium cuenoti]|uniref:Mrp/NBP35 family ATP-binding protein n=1 Tax=Blattabacterium cuenoti TaxID=1653831 RepID=UPI00163C7DA9|nr:Mrp/NBP35 family ATP-binding protein [Blattabacterium cuenoti]